MIDTTAEMDLIRQKISAAFGISEEMLTGPTTYATSSIEYDLATRGLVRKIADPVSFRTGTRDKYVKANLDWAMRRCRGRKRLRKKKAKHALRHRWEVLQMGQMLSRHILRLRGPLLSLRMSSSFRCS